MGYFSVDLGSTNIKVAVYDDRMQMKAWLSHPVRYIHDGGFVEFDAELYCDAVKEMLSAHVRNGSISSAECRQIIFTGQAESLVVLGGDGNPLMNAISWMDERSINECGQLAASFTQEECYEKTGQRAILPTWPATKILWLKKNRRDIYEQAAHYVLLKDYIVYRLTGILQADCSIATFTFYFDILNKCYWDEMLQACGIRPEQLPCLAEPCTCAGVLLPPVAKELGLAVNTKVNRGTLDHFAGMIGTGNVCEGVMNLSTGTVMALATMACKPSGGIGHTALHYGFMQDTYVFLPVAESGGVCLEWFRDNFMKGCSFSEIDTLMTARSLPNELLFLPYITGTNAPEFDADACGMFYGIRAKHDSVDFAYAVMEGVAHLLARNINDLRAGGTRTERIIATGGGAKSEVWCRLQANVAGVPVDIPEEKEAACLGAAIIGAVNDGIFDTYADAAKHTVRICKRYEPMEIPELKRKHRQFEYLYDAMLNAARI